MALVKSNLQCSAMICFLVVVVVYLDVVSSQCASNVACFAPPADVAKLPSHNLTVNSTCGNPPEDFCVSIDCSLNCDATNNQTWHPPNYLVDPYELLTYWKSRNFDEPVFIQFDFGYKLILHQVMITFQFELPNGLYIQRSQDFGKTFLTLAYFAIRCNETFGLKGTLDYNRLDVLCLMINPGEIQRQISFAPRRDQYVATEVLKDGVVRDYYLATNVKIVLQEFFTPSDFNRATADPRKFYFAVRDIDVQAACYCNGMSNQCSTKDYGTCVCQKNTEGKHCEVCKSLYNNMPWTYGKACESCNCNGHSSMCVYNAAKGFGICQDCSHNTKGDKCESCNTGFYRNSSVLVTSAAACARCNCLIAGVLFGSTVCNPLTGVCICKSNVKAGLCNECKDGYYGLSPTILNGCLVCACSTYGTIGGTIKCNKTTGVCPCKSGFTGRTCSDCQPGFYGYPQNSPTECRSCGCHPSGSMNMSCDKSGQCVCHKYYYGVRCEQIVTGFFSASVNQLIFNSRLASLSSPVTSSFMWINITDSSGNTFFILGYSLSLGGSSSSAVTSLTFTINLPASAYYEFFLQYMTSFTFTGVNMQVQLQSSFNPYSCGSTTVTTSAVSSLISNIVSQSTSVTFGSRCLMKGQYRVVVWFPPNSAGASSSTARIFILSLLLLPRYQYSAGYLNANTTVQRLIQQYYLSASSRSTWAIQQSSGAIFMSYLYGQLYSTAFACGCDSAGTINPLVCNIYGGQCNCKQSIYGRTCSACLPEHYNFTSGLGCVPCNCDSNGSLNKTCDHDTGQCHCKANVVGRTCNQCAPRYYGVSGGGGCQPCNCNALYSTSSQCDVNGNCQCKTGVGSAKCTTCAAGFYDISVTGCKTCICNPVGTFGNKCNPSTGSCTCNPLVIGTKCEQCTVGYYGFSSDFPDICLKCHCTGKTHECDAADDYYLTNVSTVFSTKINNNALQGWSSVDQNGNGAGATSWDWAPEYSFARGYIKLTDTRNTAQLFYSAPSIFLGNKRSSYMYHLTFDMTQQNTSNLIDASNVGDVIIKGKELTYKLVTNLPSAPLLHQKFQSYKVQFYEKLWKKSTTDGAQATNIEMLNTLSNLQYIYIRGKWTKDNGKFSGLSNVVMYYSTYNVTNTAGLQKVKNVEYCTCPQAYSGQFCQFCNAGYTRNPVNGGPSDNCVTCKCNGHSSNCNKNNGTCYKCLHNTEGSNCQICSAGYYGIATTGKADDCKECACPGGLKAQNQFAERCILDTDSRPTCVGCKTGYSGRQCEVCTDGYFGNPVHPLGKCEKCTCNNNVDPKAAGNCNTTTGECLRCLYNTIGASCEYCRPGYYGGALTRSCKDCSCNLIGSHGNDCQNITGQCSCKTNVVGRICDKCAKNTFNFQSNSGCELCKCHAKGSSSMQCNLVTGKCSCKPKVVGHKCDKCAPGYYDLSNGCLPCNCNDSFTVKNTTCDAITGQCSCIDSSLGGKYSGRTCNECAINAIGSPPDCELCHNPCYDNWQKYIDQERVDISQLQSNVSDLLSKFGGMSYENIQSHLTWLNGNLTYAMNVFSGAKYNTSMKESKFKQIETHIVEFETVLNRSQQQLSQSKKYFKTTVTNFNGTVSLSASVPQPLPIPLITIRVRRQVMMVPKSVDATLVTQMAQGFITTAKSNNVSGHAIYTTIQNQYNQIVSANLSIADAAKKLSEAMSGLLQSAAERARISGYFDTRYRATFAANAYELKKIHDVVANIMILQNRTVTIHQSSLATLKSAQTVIAQAESEAKTRRAEAQTISQTVSQMKVEAVTLNASVAQQQTAAANLKRTAGDVLFDVQREASSVAQSIKDIAAAKNKTEKALALAYEIGNTTMPVSLAEIQALSNQIINTVIDEGVINTTFQDAQQGLVKAKEVQKRSQQALDVSQATLQDIRNLEAAIAQSAALRTTATQTQLETDGKIKMIQNITSTIESQFNSINGQGGQTLIMLKSTMGQANANQMCFVNAKAIIDNATLVSTQARTKAQEALTIHRSNERILPTYSTQINNLYSQTSSTHTKAQTAVNGAVQLLHDVTEAQRLLGQFTTQQTELNALKTETESLEAELNNLLLKFEEQRIKFSRCNRP